MRLATALVASLLALAAPAPLKVGPLEKCPVCGMFVAKHPNWVAAIRFQDGSQVVFDGAKDLFKFLLKFQDYGPAVRRNDVEAILVTDYYGLRLVDARTAWYVLGSDVYGPMGDELVPFDSEASAREFLADHRGRSIVRFTEVTAALVRTLDD